MQAILSNGKYPEHSTVTVPFPIPEQEYNHILDSLRLLGIGDAVQRDCHLDELDFGYSSLRCLECNLVNLDELDYLAKRLDSFDKNEAAQFEATLSKLGLTDMTDIINLTFCCQQATVITDFSDLEKVGKAHFLTIQGGCAPKDELDALDGYETALLLIDSGAGVVTPYGVLYDNGMKLEQIYDGVHFPDYHYKSNMLTVGLTSRSAPKGTSEITWLYLPAARGQIDHAILRSGITAPDDMYIQYYDNEFPKEVNAILFAYRQDIHELNDLAQAIEKLSQENRVKLGAVVTMAEPEYAMQIRHLAENLDQFEFAPGAHTPAEYGKYMIQESGHFDYDPNLDGFYDYEGYGRRHVEQESGIFTDQGYIWYHGTLSLDELMMEDPAEQYQKEQGLEMGGMA